MYLDSWDEIETYKELNLASLRQGSTTCLYIYYFLRSIDTHKCGYVDADKLIKFLVKQGLTRNQLYTALHNPHCPIYFFQKDVITQGKKTSVLQYKSLENVCRSLNTVPGISVFLALNNIRTFKKFNAFVYVTLFATKNRRHQLSMSREVITQLTSLSVPTQITYEKIANVQVTPTIASYVIPDNMRHIPKDEIAKDLPCADMFYTCSKDRISWQLANKYLPTDIRVYKKRNHRANKRIKLDESLVSKDVRKRATSSKQYFQDVDSKMFTDTRTSYIRAHFDIPLHNGTKAQMYRFNTMAPTDDPTEAVYGAFINQQKFIVVNLNYPKITEIELVCQI